MRDTIPSPLTYTIRDLLQSFSGTAKRLLAFTKNIFTRASTQLTSMYVLGIDVGTGGTRVLVVDQNGHLPGAATEEHQNFASPQIGWAEQDPRDWWRACGIAVRKALAHAKVSSDKIACVGFSGQMHGAVTLDAAGEPVRPALIWCDVRT